MSSGAVVQHGSAIEAIQIRVRFDFTVDVSGKSSGKSIYIIYLGGLELIWDELELRWKSSVVVEEMYFMVNGADWMILAFYRYVIFLHHVVYGGDLVNGVV